MIDAIDVSLQPKVIALMVKDREFLARNYSMLNPAYFDSEVCSDFCGIILSYYIKYKTRITPNVLLAEVVKFLNDNKRPNPENYVAMVKSLHEDALIEKEYIKDNIIEFIREQEFKLALSKSIDLLREHDYDSILRQITKASRAGARFAQGMFYFDTDNIEERYSENNLTSKVGTGFPELDRVLGGGLGTEGELGIILASPNVGKSKTLTMVGANALRNRKKVVHLSHEMNKKKIALRYDRNLMGKNLLALKDDLDGLKTQLLNYVKNFKANLYIQDFPTRTATVDDMKREIDFISANYFEPDLVIVDYAAIVKPIRTNPRRDIEIEEVNEMLRGWAGEIGAAIWTAAQTNSSGVGKEIIDIDDFGESFAQSKVADIIIALCQTDKEYEENMLRIFVAKNRDEKKHQMFKYKTNDDIMRMQYIP